MNPGTAQFRLDMLAASEIAIAIAQAEKNPESAAYMVLLADRLNGYSKQAGREKPQIVLPSQPFTHSRQ